MSVVSQRTSPLPIFRIVYRLPILLLMFASSGCIICSSLALESTKRKEKPCVSLKQAHPVLEVYRSDDGERFMIRYRVRVNKKPTERWLCLTRDELNQWIQKENNSEDKYLVKIIHDKDKEIRYQVTIYAAERLVRNKHRWALKTMQNVPLATAADDIRPPKNALLLLADYGKSREQFSVQFILGDPQTQQAMWIDITFPDRSYDSPLGMILLVPAVACDAATWPIQLVFLAYMFAHFGG